MSSKWRHEYKYFSPERLLQVLQQRTACVLQKDPHVGEKGFYHIRSIYFDDIYNTCYEENLSGTDPREKFRIRIYNNSDKRISLELKQRKMGKCLKTSSPVSKERLLALTEFDFQNEILRPTEEDSFIYKKFYSQILYRGLKPVNIVCYDRVPYIYRTGNVRITFDRNIRSGRDFSRFFDNDLPARPILPKGTNLIEVKFDELLPDYIFELLQTGELSQTSFSKYFLCRKYGMKQTL
ncbi:MAG: polyphosphate polymerase domain-containing protein [Treponema sp.]|nr:polyphosphate polymerase domain-containing protein [Candidatus Treponema equifaecale]